MNPFTLYSAKQELDTSKFAGLFNQINFFQINKSISKSTNQFQIMQMTFDIYKVSDPSITHNTNTQLRIYAELGSLL